MVKITKKLLLDKYKKGIEERELEQPEEDLFDTFKKNLPFEVSPKNLELFEAVVESSKKTSH